MTLVDWWCVSLTIAPIACHSMPPVTPTPDSGDAAPVPTVDGGTLRSYSCPVGDGGAAWSCQDGLSTPVGTCSAMGCVPVAP